MKTICNNCCKHRDTTLILGEYLCAECVKDKYFEARKELARKDKLVTELKLKEDAQRLIDIYGEQYQLYKALEELQEFSIEITKTLQKEKTTDNLVSELSDVANIIEQVKIICNISEDEITQIRNDKNKKALSEFCQA